MLATAVGTCEEGIFSGESQRSDGTLDDVGVNFDAAVVEEAAKPLPARERIADRLGQFGLLANQGELGFEPRVESLEDRPALVLPDEASLVGTAAPDSALDAVEFGDAFQRLAGDRRRASGGEIEEAAAHMRPAEGERHGVPLGQNPIAP